MENGKQLVYEFGGFQLDAARHTLFRHGQPVALTPKLFETLVLLVENRDRTLPKDEMMHALWAETFVEEGNLSQNIFLLRKALGDDRNGHSLIHTIPRKGYRFVAPVTEIETEPAGIVPGGVGSEFWKHNSPFRSLTVFEPEDAWLFFGRDKETAALVARVSRSPVAAVVGNSGSGKSSLLRAGLIPALREGRFSRSNGSPETTAPDLRWRIAVVRPSASPFDYLAETLSGQLAPELDLKDHAEFIADCRRKLPAGGDALRNAIAALVFAAVPRTELSSTRVLVVVDQFEELFTLTARADLRHRYIDALLAAAHLDGAVAVHLVLALRADFFGHCLDYPELRGSLESNLFTLGSMTPEQMRETIEKRLALVGGRAEPGLIDSLLEDVGAEPGNLALLEHALGRLWEECGEPGCVFTNHAYAQMGRLRGALGRHADEVFANLDEPQKPMAKKIFLELVHLGDGAQDTRRRVAKSDLLRLGEPEAIELLLERLASHRLIAKGREGEETFVEVSHEALIREWPTLRQWLEENREELALERRLRQAAEEWETLNRDPGALLQGARLSQAEEWLNRHVGAQGLLQEFVKASIEARDLAIWRESEARERELKREKLTARRFRWFSYALAFLFLVAAISAGFAYRQRILEESRALAGQAEILSSNDRGQALDLAIRSWQTAKTDEARLAIARVFPEPQLVLHHEDAVYNVAYSADGERILSAGHDSAGKLWSARDGQLLAVLQHDGPLMDGEFSPDGKLIVTASEDHTARVWDGVDGHLLAILRGHTGGIARANFSTDGRFVVTAGLDHTARLWNSSDGRLLLTLAGHTEWVYDARFSPDGRHILTTSWDHTARLWNATNGRVEEILRGHTEGVFYGVFSPDGQSVVTASVDRTARIWNSNDGRLLAVLTHKGNVAHIVFSPDGRLIATSGYDGCVKIWSLDGALRLTLRHDGPVHHVEFSPDGRWVASASLDRTARIWSAADGRLLAILSGHTKELYHLAFAPSGEQIVTGSGDATVRTWSLRSARSNSILRQHDSAIESLGLSQDGTLLGTAGDDRMARVWDASDGQMRFLLLGHTGDVTRIVFSPDGSRIATASRDNTARIWSGQDGRLLHVLSGHTAWVKDVGFSPDGRQIVTASDDHTVRIWDAATGQLRALLPCGTDSMMHARFYPDGRRIFTIGSSAVRIWNSEGQLLATIGKPSDQIDHGYISGEKIVIGSEDGAVRLWTSDGRLLRELHIVGRIRAVGFSRDGTKIFATGMDQLVRVWRVSDGVLISTLRGHTDYVWHTQFSPDGKQVITASSDETARVWDAANGQILTTLQGHTAWVTCAAFSLDGRHIFTTSKDQTARIWEILTLDDIERILSK